LVHSPIPESRSAAEKVGKAILFKKVKGSRLQVVNNLFVSREMLVLLVETTPEHVVNEWIDRVKAPIEPEVVSSLAERDRVDIQKASVTH